MYYEEKIIGGVLCYRNTPDGIWNPIMDTEDIYYWMYDEKTS